MPSIKNTWFNTFRRRIDKRSVKELMKASGVNLIFPFYHVVSNDHLPHIQHLYTYRNVAQFETDMDFLMRHFTPLHFDDLLSGRYQPDTPYFHLSFDDGLSEMLHIVRPILLEKGIPASFFINSAFVNNQGLFYRYKVSILIDQVPAADLAAAIADVGEMKGGRVQDPARFLLSLNANNESFIDQIASSLRFDFRAFTATVQPYMDLDQLLQLQKDGFSIGAHSVDHPEFKALAVASQLEQIKQSVAFIREKLHCPHPAFAFPFTADGAAPEVFEQMYQQFGVSKSFGTAGIKNQHNPNHIERIPAEYKDWPLETIVKAEYHYFLTKKMIGK